ncbi:poly(A) RNA polymerase, mitochondrial-like [Contarinia nasturtii]|uniref:poly(A) RNA polymerase, mitochondrial-like n=1 Tax=Contarinia nasturtii TaxID=265458 RepID=UPI0012D4BDC9|nr:poly(A) RNA polymerase, mitochondrial-like [Contarinia nasturtii]
MLKYTNKLNNLSLPFRGVPFWLTHQIQLRHRHDDKKNASNNRPNFQNAISMRQIEAKKSILIETDRDPNTIKKVIAYCSNARVKNIYRKDDVDGKISHFLVEFENFSTVNNIITTAFHPGNFLLDSKIRAKGRFLRFNPIHNPTRENRSNVPVKVERNITEHELLLKEMRKEKSIDKQIMTLYKSNRLSDFSTRLRFLTALQLEEALSGVFHQPKVLPFGSSINGFGRMQSDLDMILLSCGNRIRNCPFDVMEVGPLDGRFSVRNNLHLISNIARNWLHGVKHVEPILNARVPIIKYHQKLTCLECDLSMSNISGFQMSEILYTLGEMDWRVRPFVFYMRTWAQSFGIMQGYPSLGLSNFMLTCLAIFFLQQLPQPVLPPIDDFMKLIVTDDKIPSITDSTKLNFKSKNTSTLTQLLMEFFDFYASFNFQEDAVSISAGSIKVNVGAESMYIYNPLDVGVNVSRNITDYERNDFVNKCRFAQNALANDKLDAVALLELVGEGNIASKLDSFVHNMVNMNKDKISSNNKTVKRKFIVKTILS